MSVRLGSRASFGGGPGRYRRGESDMDLRDLESAHIVPRIVVISPIRVYREGLAYMLAQQRSVDIVGAAGRIHELTHLFSTAAVDVVLFDLAVDGGLSALQWLRTNFQL